MNNIITMNININIVNLDVWLNDLENVISPSPKGSRYLWKFFVSFKGFYDFAIANAAMFRNVQQLP